MKYVPSETYTFEQFIDMQSQDDFTYANFAVFENEVKMKMVRQSILDYYLKELRKICLKVTEFSHSDIVRFKYAPDLLAYYVYGTTQLDFIILLANGIIDPKEFDFKWSELLLPQKSLLFDLMGRIYNAESTWIQLSKREY